MKHATIPEPKPAPGRSRMSTAVLDNKTIVRMADRWACPFCGKCLHPTDLEMTEDGVRMLCGNCHHDVLTIEWPWP